METFYLGTHKPGWLELADVPLFISNRQLASRKRLPRARARWCLDGGGFTELSMYGRWHTKATDYAARVITYQDEIGMLDWAAPQDWMCEPIMLERTGLSIVEHQTRTIASLLELRALAPRVPWIPVLQGWEPADYREHVEAYGRAGVRLSDEPTVGVGSVCRRQGTKVATQIVSSLAGMGIRIHAFGIKVLGLQQFGHLIKSSDSLAWSFQARKKQIRMPGCTHATCANCLVWALAWRERVLSTRVQQQQLDMFA